MARTRDGENDLGKLVMRAGRNQLGKASSAENKLFYSLKQACSLLWIFTAHMSLNFSSTPPWLVWQQDTHPKLPEGSGRRGYKAMQSCTSNDDQGFLLSGLTSFRYMYCAERASPF